MIWEDGQWLSDDRTAWFYSDRFSTDGLGNPFPSWILWTGGHHEIYDSELESLMRLAELESQRASDQP